jgi:hypothetical protein
MSEKKAEFAAGLAELRRLWQVAWDVQRKNGMATMHGIKSFFLK